MTLRYLEEVRRDWADPEAFKKTKADSMYLSNLSRALSLFSLLLDEKEVKEGIITESKYATDEQSFQDWQEDYLVTAKALLETAKEETRLGPVYKSVKQQTPFREFSCYPLFAQTGLWRAKGSKRGDLDAEYVREKLDEIRSATVVGRANVFGSLQVILPCIHAAYDLSSKYPETKKIATFLVQETILRNWDSPKRKLCHGDFSFLANFVPSMSTDCKTYAKAMSDQAWAGYLLSLDQDDFKIYSY